VILARQFIQAFLGGLGSLVRQRLFLGLLVIALLVACAPLVFPARAFTRMAGDELFGFPAYGFVLQFVLPLVGTYFGLASLHSELADGSAVHVLTLPVPRAVLLAGRFFAVALGVMIALGCVLTVYWSTLALVPRPWRLGLAPRRETLTAFLAGVALATPAYVAFGALAAAWFRRPFLAAILFVVGWEAGISNMPPGAGIRSLTVADPLRRFLYEEIGKGADNRLGEFLTQSLDPEILQRMPDPIRGMATFAVIVLLLALIVFTRGEYRLRTLGDE
jgi:hypothetical protein